MLRELVKIANRLDNLGLNKEADILDGFISKIAGFDDWTGIPKEEPKGIKEKYEENMRAYPDVRMAESKEGYIARAKEGGSPLSDQQLGDFYDSETAGSISTPPKPSGAHAPVKTPVKKKPATSQQLWDAYIKRVPGGADVKEAWEKNAANLKVSSDYSSFSTWLKDFMAKTKKSVIDAKNLSYWITVAGAVNNSKPHLMPLFMQAVEQGRKEKVSDIFSSTFSSGASAAKKEREGQFGKEIAKELES